MASVSEELRRRVYGAAAPSEKQIQAVRQKAYTLAPVSTASSKEEEKTPAKASSGLFQTLLDSAKKAVTDTSTMDTVVDSTTGQVISAGKTSGTGNWKTKPVRQAVGAGRGGRVDYAQVEVPTLAGRVASTVSGAVKSAASDLSNMAATLYESGQTRRSQENESLLQQYTQELERAQRDLQVMREMGIRGAGLQGQQNIVEAAQRKVDALQKVTGGNVQQKATQAAYDAVERLDQSAGKDLDLAKQGLGKVGTTLVDAGAAGVQMAGDIALGAVTGGGALIPMAARGFGGAAKEARQAGASLGQQLGYGAASAALSAATERLSNLAKPFSQAFGKGFADDMTEEIIGRAVDKLATSAAGKTAINALLRTGASAAGEAVEEMAEDVLAPVLKLIYQSDSRETALENLKRTYGENFDVSQMLYDGLIGGILGVVGGGVDTAMTARGDYRGYRQQQAEKAVDAAYDTMAREGMFSPQAREAVRRAQRAGENVVNYDITPRLDAGINRAETLRKPGGNAMMGAETAEQEADYGSQTVQHGGSPGKDSPVQRVQSSGQGADSRRTRTSETAADFAARNAAQGRTTAVLGGRTYGFRRVDTREWSEYSKNCVEGFRRLGIPVEVMLGNLESNRGDVTIGTSGDAVTAADGTVFIKNDTQGFTPQEIVGHEGFHSMLKQRRGAALSYQETVMDQLSWSDPLAMEFLENITEHYFPNGYDATNAAQTAKFLDELSAYVSGMMNDGLDLSFLFRDYSRVQSDWEQMMGSASRTVPGGVNMTDGQTGAEPPVGRTSAERADARGSGALDTLGVYVVDDLGDYTSALQMRSREAGKKKTSQARRQAERRLNPTRGEKNFAQGIAQGDYTAADIPASMRRQVVEELADYYTAENSFKAVDGVKMRGQEIREETENLARELLGDDTAYHPIPMLLMNEKTPERVMRRLFGDRQGEQMNQTYIYPVQQNEAEKLRFINRMLDQVRTVQDSTGKQSPLTRQERSVVQQMLEDRFVGETIASMETAESIRNAAVNIKNGKDVGDSAREFSLRGEEVDLARQLARWMGNQELIQSGQLDGVKIQNAVDAYSKQYDLFYDAINDFLTAHGYSTIGFIKGYAPHMQKADTQNKLSSALQSMGVNLDAGALPTSISGLTADYQPGKRWNPFFQTRRGSSTDYDAAAGYESYVTHLADILYHTDDIARLRGLSRYLRKTYGPEEISDAIDHAEGLRSMDAQSQMEVLRDAGRITQGTTLTAQDARTELESYIDSLYEDIKNVSRYSEFVKYIDNYANILAGKQSMADRGMEYTAGRTSLNAGNRLVSAFAKAQVAGNLSSALNQSAQLAQLLAEVDGKSVAKAAAELVRSTGGKLWNIKATELFDQSDLLTSKKGINYLTADDNRLDQFITTLFKPADMMDSLISALTIQSRYEQLRAQGLEHGVAMDEANRFATSIMASRAKGSRPLSYESKNLISQMLHMFQVEAVNSWDHIAQDLPRQYRQVAAEHGKQAAGRAVATVAVKGLLSAFMLNRITEAAYGGTPAPFDVLGYVANFLASGSGMSTNAWLEELVNSAWEKLFGEPLFGDGDDREEEEKPFNLGQATDDLVYNLLNDIPFVRNAAGLLGLGDQTMPLTNIAEAVQGVGQAAQNSGVFSGETGGALLTLGASMLPGGRQLQKTSQGIQTIWNQGRMYGYGDDQRLQYPVERDPFNIVQAVLFGNSGLAESRDFYASGNTGLSAKQTQLVKEMGDAGANRTAVYDAIQEIRSGADAEEKLQALSQADLSDGEKLQVFAGIIAGADNQHTQDIRALLDLGVGWDQIAETYPIGSSSAARRYTGYVESGLSPEDAGGLSAEMEALEPETGKDSVTDLQRYRTVVDYGLSQQEQLTVLRDMMEDSEYETLMSAYQKGIAPEQFITFREGISGLSADKNLAGKTISGSKKRKVLAYIDTMDLNNAQKTALYYAAGYAASTLSDAPWYGRPESQWDIIPRLDG